MSTASDPYSRTEIRDGMRITWHQPIRVDDGLVLRADVYRPEQTGDRPRFSISSAGNGGLSPFVQIAEMLKRRVERVAPRRPRKEKADLAETPTRPG